MVTPLRVRASEITLKYSKVNQIAVTIAVQITAKGAVQSILRVRGDARPERRVIAGIRGVRYAINVTKGDLNSDGSAGSIRNGKKLHVKHEPGIRRYPRSGIASLAESQLWRHEHPPHAANIH